MVKHLAIFRQPFLDLIFDGQKTVESRFSKIRCVPHGKIVAGDMILAKESGGLVLGEFVAGRVESIDNAVRKDLERIKGRYSKQICSNFWPGFWEARKNSRYITLIHIKDPKRYLSPFYFPKRDRRGWVVLSPQAVQNLIEQ